MARILKVGDKYICAKLHQYTCRTCDSEIEFDESTDRSSDQRDGSWYVCPVCGSYLDARAVEARKPSNPDARR